MQISVSSTLTVYHASSSAQSRQTRRSCSSSYENGSPCDSGERQTPLRSRRRRAPSAACAKRPESYLAAL